MSALLDSLAAGFDGDAVRRDALQAALREGLPGPRSEAWKYTSLRALERRSFATVAAHDTRPAIDPALVAAIPSPRLVFANGRFDAASSDLTALRGQAGVELAPLASAPANGASNDTHGVRSIGTGSDDVFARLNGALARDGVVLRIAAGVAVELPLHLVFVGVVGDADLAWHARHSIRLDRGASAVVVEHHLAQGAHAHLGNALGHVHLAAGARLTHLRLQDEAPGATLFTRNDAVLSEHAHYRRIDLELGGALSRHELNVRLQGENARAQADGVLFADGKRQLDTRLGIEHAAPGTACELTWRGLAAGRARAAFHGGIVILAGADGSDAMLSNKNLLLSDAAEIDTQPVLEIHADVLKASHGATVGQLYPTALFYLRSRGLPEGAARRLLTAAFCREVVAALPDPELRGWLETRLDHALARLADA